MGTIMTEDRVGTEERAPLDILVRELDSHIRDLDGFPEEFRRKALRILQLVDLVHRPGVRRLAERLSEAGMREELLQEKGVSLLLMLYDVVPVDEALEEGRQGTWIELPVMAAGAEHLVTKGPGNRANGGHEDEREAGEGG
jgi:hypothetical protein